MRCTVRLRVVTAGASAEATGVDGAVVGGAEITDVVVRGVTDWRCVQDDSRETVGVVGAAITVRGADDRTVVRDGAMVTVRSTGRD